MKHSLLELLGMFRIWFYRNMTTAVFLILPNKVSSIFVSLSILSLIYDVRKIDIKECPIADEKFKTLLKVSFNEDIMLFPQHTVHWFWCDQYLDKKIQIKGNNMSIRQALEDNNILFSNLRVIVEELLQNIPPALKYKLGFRITKKKLEVKHTVMNLLIHV